MSNNPFGDLSYAQYTPTYVGLPLDRIKETGDVLHEKYTASVENANKTKIALANIQLHAKDEQHRQEASRILNIDLNPFEEKGNWEDALYAVQNAATKIATNSGLLQASKSEQMRVEQNAALDVRRIKGELNESDVEAAKAKAEEKYQGVQQNPVTKAWTGHYETPNPPSYVDIGEYTNKFLTGYASNKSMGRYVKDPQGNWTIGKEEGVNADGTLNLTYSTTYATYKEVYLAAREHIKQNRDIDERLNWEVEKSGVTFVDKLAADPDARKAMEKDLIETLKFDENKIKSMNDEELTKTHAKELELHQGIEGSAIKHSFVEESVISLGETFKKQQWDAVNRAVRGGGGSGGGVTTPDVLEMEQVFGMGLTQGYTPTGVPFGVEEYNTQLDGMIAVSKNQTLTVARQRADILEWQRLNPGKEVSAAKVQALAEAETARAKQDNDIYQLQKIYNEAVDRVVAKNPNSQVTQTVKDTEDFYNSLPLQSVSTAKFISTKLDEASAILKMTPSDVANFLRSNTGANQSNLANSYNTHMNNNSLPAKKEDLQKLLEIGNAITQEELKTDPTSRFGFNYMGLANDVVALKDKTYSSNKEIADELALMSTERTANYAYVDLSIDNTKDLTNNESAFTKNVTDRFRKTPTEFIHIGTDGKERTYQDNATSGYNPQNTKMIGMTTDYIHGHGYCVYASEDIYSADGKTIVQTKNHLFKATNAQTQQYLTSQTALALKKARISTATNSINTEGIYDTKKGYNDGNEILAKMQHFEIDKQMTYLQDIPENPPTITSGKAYTDVVTEVICGPNRYAKVTRRTDVAGVTHFMVEHKIRAGKNGTPEIIANPDGEYTTRYNTYAQVESVLEGWGGVGVNNDVYKVDMPTLAKVTEAQVPYAKFNMDTRSMPKLEGEFKNTLIHLLNGAKTKVSIKTMTQSSQLNQDIGSDINSAHLYGRGALIELDPKIDKADQTVNDVYKNGAKDLMAYLVQYSNDVNKSEYNFAEVPTSLTKKDAQGKPINPQRLYWKVVEFEGKQYLDIKKVEDK